MTSRDAVNQIQRLVRPAKIGHAGTLDPLANGVLIVCIGNATRLIEYVQRLPKTYCATFLLGRTSDTDDVEGTIRELTGSAEPTLEAIEAALPRFVGPISQRPPAYSAVKIQGKRAYELARRGEAVDLQPRTVMIHSLKLIRYEYPALELLVHCGSGTYIRSLGRDLAESVGTGAIMSALTRSAIGDFNIEDAVDPRDVDERNLPAFMQPSAAAIRALPTLTLAADEVTHVLNGRFLRREKHGYQQEAAALRPDGSLLAVLVPIDDSTLRPEKVLP